MRDDGREFIYDEMETRRKMNIFILANYEREMKV